MNTSEVKRLDRTRPAPGGNYSEGAPAERVAKLARAWAHDEREHDPPGMWVDVREWGVDGLSYDDTATLADNEDAARTAAWAWYWRRVALDARLARGPFAPLTCECGGGAARDGGAKPCAHTDERRMVLMTEFWPRCLAWSDEQVAEVERWLTEGGELPEVLRG